MRHRALSEAARARGDRGRVVVPGFLVPREKWTVARLGDHWLGPSEETLRKWMIAAKLVALEVWPATSGAGNETFAVAAAVGAKSRACFRHLKGRARA